MSITNLAIVFGPTLFGQEGGGGMADTVHQNHVRAFSFHSSIWSVLTDTFFQAVETILKHYTDIFIDENDAT